ncbi:hypothetical protein GCM10011506_09910 [Marivirga lumbricoides]|uniref:TolC family protein n=1 Tax=Marivirga lumbricoides TaxID=1046115 RepID=A0ABQ1LLU4_9BACT|nr:hypothetical protein GCM10011506_09910 [Marivirga lumbricoides]
MTKNQLLIVLFIWSVESFMYFPAKSQIIQSDSLNLKDAIELGLENSRELKKAVLDEESAELLKKEVRGSGLPQLNAYGNYNNFIEVYPQAVPSGLFGPGTPGEVDVIALGVPQSLQAGIQANQLLYSSSFFIGLKAAKTSEEFYRLLSSQSEEEVIYDISMAFLGTVQLSLHRENLLANIDQLTGLEKIVTAQVENDLARSVDLKRIKVSLSSLNSELENLDVSIFQNKSYLKLLMGVPQETDFELKKSEIISEMLPLTYSVDRLDLTERKDLQVLEMQSTLLDFEYKNTKANLHPNLVAFADYNTNSFATEFDYLSESKNWYQGFLIGLKLQVPLFDGFVTRSKAQQVKVKKLQLQQDYSLAKDAARMEYDNANKKYYNSIRTLKSLEENLSLANEVLDETQLLYKESLSPLTEVLDAESAQRQARTNYNNQIVQVKIAQIEILKSTGKIKEIIL